MSRATLGELVSSVRERVEAEQAGEWCLGLEHLVADHLRIEGSERPIRRRTALLRFEAGDVLFGALRPGQRKVAIARSPGACSSELLVLRPRPGIGSGLALAALAHPITIRAAQRLATGTRMPRVRWQALREVEIALPHPTKRSTLDRLMGLLDDRLDNLHREQQLTAELLRRLVEAHRAEGGPALHEIATLRGERPTPIEALREGERYYGVGDLPSEGLDIHTWSTSRPRSGRRAVRRGEILVSLLRPELHRVGLCPANGWASPEIIPIRPAPGWLGAVLGSLRSPAIQQRWIGAASGARMPRFSLTTLRATPVCLGRAEQPRLAPCLDALAHSLLHGSHQAEALRRTRESAILTALTQTAIPSDLGEQRAIG